MTGFPIGWDPASGLGMPPRVLDSIYYGASKLVSFTAGDRANKCIGFAADSAAKKCVDFTVDDAECVSASANRTKQHISRIWKC